MNTAEQLETLTEKLAVLEAQMNGVSGPTSEAGGSGSSPGPVTVKVFREFKFAGVIDDLLIQDWILDAK